MVHSEKIRAVTAQPDKTYRLLIPWDAIPRVFVSFQVKKDASFYLWGGKASKQYYGQVTKPAGTHDMHIDFLSGTPIDDSDMLKDTHTSFHGSGVVNARVGRAIGHPLKSIEGTVQLCTALFPHPSKLKIPSDKRRTDVTFEYPLDQACPLSLNILASPRKRIYLANIRDAIMQAAFGFIYQRLLPQDDLVIVLRFYHGPESPWPDGKALIYPTDINEMGWNAG